MSLRRAYGCGQWSQRMGVHEMRNKNLMCPQYPVKRAFSGSAVGLDTVSLSFLKPCPRSWTAKTGCLGSFFFFRASGEMSRIAKVTVTLACQMADAIPGTRLWVRAALRRLHGVQEASPRTRFRRLLFQPLQTVLVARQGRRRIVQLCSQRARRI